MKKYNKVITSRMIQEALKKAVRKMLVERKLFDVPVSIWQDGKVVTIPAHKIDMKKLGL